MSYNNKRREWRPQNPGRARSRATRSSGSLPPGVIATTSSTTTMSATMSAAGASQPPKSSPATCRSPTRSAPRKSGTRRRTPPQPQRCRRRFTRSATGPFHLARGRGRPRPRGAAAHRPEPPARPRPCRPSRGRRGLARAAGGGARASRRTGAARPGSGLRYGLYAAEDRLSMRSSPPSSRNPRAWARTRRSSTACRRRRRAGGLFGPGRGERGRPRRPAPGGRLQDILDLAQTGVGYEQPDVEKYARSLRPIVTQFQDDRAALAAALPGPGLWARGHDQRDCASLCRGAPASWRGRTPSKRWSSGGRATCLHDHVDELLQAAALKQWMAERNITLGAKFGPRGLVAQRHGRLAAAGAAHAALSRSERGSTASSSR